MLKVIVAGGRDFDDFSLLRKTLDQVLAKHKKVEIVSGGADGADYFGEKYALLKGFQVKKFPADWDKHGKAAGPIRNKQMAEYADCLVAFWDGESFGTSDMINTATEKGLKIRVVKYKKK